MDNLALNKIQNFYSVKDTVKKIKSQTADGEKAFTNDISNKGYVSRMHKELSKLNSKKTNKKS